ncbi:MAG: GNAT family N-acetyltransferase [Pseudomonadota bacterium]
MTTDAYLADWTRIDVDALFELLSDAFEWQRSRIDPPSSLHSLTPGDLARKAEAEDVFLIGEPVEGCLFGDLRGAVYHLSKWAVCPTAQGKGHGRSMLAVAQKRARNLGAARLRLGTRIELLPNHRRFRALGFEMRGAQRHSGFTRPTSLIFEMQVPRSN